MYIYIYIYIYIYVYICIFFSIWVFFHDHSQFTGLQGKREGIYLTPHYHFHPLHRHLDISRAITAESSPLHIACSPDSNREPCMYVCMYVGMYIYIFIYIYVYIYIYIYIYIYVYICIFFSIWVFFHDHSQFTGLQGKREGIYLTPHYHFHPLHRHLDISRAITAESSPLHIACSPDSNREPLVSERKSLSTELRTLNIYTRPHIYT